MFSTLEKKLVLTHFVVFQSSHRFNYFNIKHFLKKIIACTRKGCGDSKRLGTIVLETKKVLVTYLYYNLSSTLKYKPDTEKFRYLIVYLFYTILN